MKPCFRLWLSLGWFLVFASSVRSQLIISEFMADNKTTLADQDGKFPDWIEIYNTSGSNVSLNGWSLTDDPTHQARWFFPATNLTARGFMVIFASGTNRVVLGQPLHADFNLKAGGEYLALLKPDGSVATEFAPRFPQQFPDISYGLGQNVTTNTLLDAGAPTQVIIPPSGTLGPTWTQTSFNDSSWNSGATGVGYETAVPGFAVYNYLASVGVCSLAAAEGVISDPSQQVAGYAENAPVINYLNTGDSAHYQNDSTFPGLTVGVDQDNFALRCVDLSGHWVFAPSLG